MAVVLLALAVVLVLRILRDLVELLRARWWEGSESLVDEGGVVV